MRSEASFCCDQADCPLGYRYREKLKDEDFYQFKVLEKKLLQAMETVSPARENYSAILNHALLRFTYIFDARMADYIHTHPYGSLLHADCAILCLSRSLSLAQLRWTTYRTLYLHTHTIIHIQNASESNPILSLFVSRQSPVPRLSSQLRTQ